MQHFLIKRADGSVAIMVADDDTTCEAEIAKWSPEMQAEIVGHEPLELDSRADRTATSATPGRMLRRAERLARSRSIW